MQHNTIRHPKLVFHTSTKVFLASVSWKTEGPAGKEKYRVCGFLTAVMSERNGGGVMKDGLTRLMIVNTNGPKR